jgi:hypothetical protein
MRFRVDHWDGGQAGAVTPSVIVGGQTIDAGTLTTVAGLDPATVVAEGKAAGQAIGEQFGAQVKSSWDAATSNAANESRKWQGAADAIDLASHGYNPDDQADNAKLVGVIAGALAFVPVVGPILSGALALLYVIGEGIADLLKSTGLIWYGCRTSGNWTPRTILDGIASAGGLPPMPAGSFASLVMPALAKNAADLANCKSGYSNLQIIAAISQLWNANASGPSQTIYVPAIDVWGGGNIFAVAEQSRAAFQPSSTVTDILGDLGAQSGSGIAYVQEEPFMLTLNGSTLLSATADAQAAIARVRAQVQLGSATARTVQLGAASSPVSLPVVAVGSLAVLALLKPKLLASILAKVGL